ncbi:DUF2220 domain-containing protein [Pseudomonas asiatica]|uniref:Wadjet protein JetD C-terminal domain-containing protein n=1 Tax=Pseudomonas monteilii TaxID=76759 RepID=A0A2N1IN31_9PSED|nr:MULTISPECIES: Wadjet anti-phage system protein JetD domain-containing protein [Pseudomonas]PKI19657.1 hypothetical protein CXB65_21625 [Pseudomonas monteilii]RPD93830.1 hypothetical protein EGN69_13220 [Pseudomonas monteilii]WDM87335.1 DUF2220 domain-containing protein [Pseudomonas asiatica]
MAAIYDYLIKIRAGEPINLEALFNRLLACGITGSEASRILVGQRLPRGAARYAVIIQDEEAFAQLLERFTPSKIAGRVGAALDGNSHRAGVSEAFLLLRSEQNPHPIVAITEEGHWLAPRPLAKYAVIVENLENFLRFSETLAFLRELLPAAATDVEIIYGSGNQITNRLNGPLLARFQALYCLFDVDLGGLRMFKTLKALVASQPIHFLTPEDIPSRLARSKFVLSSLQRQELFAYYRNLSAETDMLIAHMRAAGKTLEQETYLAPSHRDVED